MFDRDAASDAITHFIGLFQLADLRARLRLDYDELAATPLSVETGPIALHHTPVPHPYAPRDFVPEVRYVPPPPDLGEVDNPAALGPVPLPPGPFVTLAPFAPQLFSQGPALDSAQPQVQITVEWHLPAPGSAAVVIVQHATLQDNDSLDAHKFDGAVAQDDLAAVLDGLAQTATAAGVSADLHLPAGEADFLIMAQHLAEASVPVLAEGADVFTAFGADAMGSHLDGVAGEARPDIDDLLPTAWKDATSRDDDDEGPAHEIVHGANMLVNEVTLTASWISAPVIAVAGASYTFDLISQVNLWQDIDSVTGLAESVWNGAGNATEAFNFAALTCAPHPLPVPAQGDDAAPAFWVVTTIEGSLINFNWVEQRNFVSDNDVTSITLQGNETTMVFGANQSVNQISLVELGAQFDLIIVDGNLINLAAILQTNVLLDSDHVIMRDGDALSTGDNLLLNDASILQVGQGQHMPATGGFQQLLANGSDDLPSDVLNDPAFAGVDVLRVLHVTGDLVSAQIIQQLNILGDADQVDLLAAQAMANAGDVSVVTGSNVLINTAHIAEFGVDSTIHTGGGVYSDALIHQAELIDTESPFASTGLASEAVVFLADGMAATMDIGDAGIAPLLAGDGLPADPMQTVLA